MQRVPCNICHLSSQLEPERGRQLPRFALARRPPKAATLYCTLYVGRQKLRSLEDRLQTQVEGSLGDALSRGQDDDNMRKLCGLLLAVDR